MQLSLMMKEMLTADLKVFTLRTKHVRSPDKKSLRDCYVLRNTHTCSQMFISDIKLIVFIF